MITNDVVNQAIDYIHTHISEEISLEEVTDYCHFSKFYFSRIFKEETGESVYFFIKRLRLEQSAFRLKVDKDKTITDIAANYGYSSSNYAVAFRQHHNVSPVHFRKTTLEKSINHPFNHVSTQDFESFEQCAKKITIEEIKDFRVLFERSIGNYHELGRAWCDFTVKYSALITEDTVMIERTYDDPSITDDDSCIYDICMCVDESCPYPNTCMVEGGMFLVYHFSGHVSTIYAAYQSVFNIYLPQSDYEIDERYGFDRYQHVDCGNGFVEMEICIPVRKR